MPSQSMRLRNMKQFVKCGLHSRAVRMLLEQLCLLACFPGIEELMNKEAWHDKQQKNSQQQLLSVTLQECSPEYLFVRCIRQTLEFVFCWGLIYFHPQINLHMNQFCFQVFKSLITKPTPLLIVEQLYVDIRRENCQKELAH